MRRSRFDPAKDRPRDLLNRMHGALLFHNIDKDGLLDLTWDDLQHASQDSRRLSHFWLEMKHKSDLLDDVLAEKRREYEMGEIVDRDGKTHRGLVRKKVIPSDRPYWWSRIDDHAVDNLRSWIPRNTLP